MLKKLFILSNVIFLLCTINLYGQQSPSGIDWKSIDTGTYEIIFPAELAPLGQRVANLMVHYEKYNYSSLTTIPRRIPIVLINNYSEANGFVSLAPFYSHWFTTPASFDSLEWFKGLAIHEGRHMVQVNKIHYRDGLLYILLGDLGTALFTGIYVPAWFMEGDAVLMETALTKGGRGRIPAFDLWHRTLELSGVRYSYYQSYLGSYKSLYPYSDHYRLGYLLCAYVRKHYGKEVWDKVLSNTARGFFSLNFNSALINETGLSIDEMYGKALDEYRALWTDQRQGLKFSDAEILNSEKENRWESFYSPIFDDEHGLFAVNFSMDKKLSLVKIAGDKKYSKIADVPYGIASSFIRNEKNLSVGGGKALWREQVPDPRWGYRTWTDLRLFDLGTGSSELITTRGKYITSTLSPDGTVAAGIEYGADLKYFMSIVDIKSRKLILRDQILNKGYLFDISISGDKNDVALAALSDDGCAILLYNIESRTVKEIVKYTYAERLRSPVFYQNYIIYQSDYSGIDNIYAADMLSGKRFQITSRPFGAYFPSVSNGMLYFNDYSKNGYQAASMKLDRKKWVPLDKIERREIGYIDEIAAQELKGDNGNVDLIPVNEYPVKDYSHIRNAVNFYGWFWFPLEFLFISRKYNISLLAISKNVLQTTDIIVDYTYNFNENKHSAGASLAYSGLYPVITVRGGYGGRAVFLYDESKDAHRDIYKTWNEIKAGGTISFPLNLSRGIRTTGIEFGAGTDYLKLYDQNDVDYEMYDNMKENGELVSAKYFLSFSSIKSGARNSVTPGTGAGLSLSYEHTPYGDYRGSQISGEADIYLPGFTDNQGLVLSGSYEKIEYDTYVFPQKALFPRGYKELRYEQYYKGTVDYRFPLINFPIVISESYGLYISRVWKLLYFKRINGDIFFDYGAGTTKSETVIYRSAGGELTMEHNWLSNMYIALEIGMRYSYCFDYKNNEENDKHVIGIVIKAPL